MNLRLIDIDTYCSVAEKELGVFASRNWLSIYAGQLVCVGIFKDEKQMIGGFYYLETKKFGLNMIKLPPYTPHCGLFVLSDNKNKASKNSFYKEVIGEVSNWFSQKKAAVCILAFPSAVTDLQPFIWAKYKVVPNYTYRIDLKHSMDEIRANFDPKNRNIIAKAQKEEVSVKDFDGPSVQVYSFFRSSLLLAGANVYDEELQRIFKEFASGSNSFCLAAYRQSQLLGMVFCVFDAHTCYYLLGGTEKQNKVNGVNNLLLQECIQKARSLNCSVFDFEGSMLPGVEKFFRSFGGELHPYYTANKALLPLEWILKFKKRELF